MSTEDYEMGAVHNLIETLQRIGRGAHHRLVRGVRPAVAASRQGPKHLKIGAAVGYKPEPQWRTTMVHSKGDGV